MAKLKRKKEERKGRLSNYTKIMVQLQIKNQSWMALTTLLFKWSLEQLENFTKKCSMSSDRIHQNILTRILKRVRQLSSRELFLLQICQFTSNNFASNFSKDLCKNYSKTRARKLTSFINLF